MSYVLQRVGGVCASLILASCATWQMPSDFSDAELRARALTETVRDVRLSAAVLGAEDSRRMFGAEVNATDVQPVWVEVENRTSQSLWLLRPGVDPDYFSPLEVAWSLHATFAGKTNAKIDDHLDQLGFKNPIAPGTTRSGILFTNPARVTKLLNVDLLGKRTLIPFSLSLPVPDQAANARTALASIRYPEEEIPDYTDVAAFRAAIEALPCCATDAQGAKQGDPLNLILVGEIDDIAAAFVRRNYRSSARPSDMAQYVFGRAPFLVGRKQAQAGAPATWIRFWLAPMRMDGQPVFIAQVGRPVGGRFEPRDAANLVLHHSVDEARSILIQDLMYSGGLQKLGFATGVGAASEEEPRSTSEGAHYDTDGLRAVMFFATRPLSLEDVEVLDWEPYLEWRERAAVRAQETKDAPTP